MHPGSDSAHVLLTAPVKEGDSAWHAMQPGWMHGEERGNSLKFLMRAKFWKKFQAEGALY